MFYKKAFEREVREHVRERQQWEIERAALLDRIMLLAGSPWTPPPLAPIEPVAERTILQPDEYLDGEMAYG